MKRFTGAGTIAALALTCVFGATMLLSLAAGSSVYRQVEERVEANSEQRVGLSYITARIHAGDETGMVRVEPFGGVEAVYLSENLGGQTYDNILYVYDGWLMELLCEQGEAEALGPEAGQTISEALSLSVSEPAEGLLRLEFTDAAGENETADVYLRSGG